MLIQYLADTDTKLIAVSAEELTAFSNNIVDYTKVILTVFDCTTEFEQEYLTADIELDTNKFYIVDGVLYINPTMIGLTAFTDSLLKITIRLQKDNAYVQIQNCYFVDVTYKCKVAALIQNLISENKDQEGEQTSTIIHLLHYALFNASNCGCNCEEMCTVFNELTKLITDIDPQILEDCGC